MSLPVAHTDTLFYGDCDQAEQIQFVPATGGFPDSGAHVGSVLALHGRQRNDLADIMCPTSLVVYAKAVACNVGSGWNVEDDRSAIQSTLSQVRTFLAQESPPKLSEADTKANFIEPIIAALGWTGIGVVIREYFVKNSHEYIDYVMVGTGGNLLAIEAKPLQSELTEKNAAQLVQYCAVEGIEWAAVTNGRELQFFNTFLKPDLAAKRVFSVDMLAFSGDEEFEVLFDQIRQLSRERLSTPAGAKTWLNQRRLDAALRSILHDSGSIFLLQLQEALRDSELTVSAPELAQWFRNHLGPSKANLAKRQLEKPSNQPLAEFPGDSSLNASHPIIFAGNRRVLLPLFETIRQQVDIRWTDTGWRSLQQYIAAESQGATFLAVKSNRNQLIIGLSLPSEVQSDRISVTAGEFSWPRMTKVARVTAIEEIDEELLGLIEAARSYASQTSRKQK